MQRRWHFWAALLLVSWVGSATADQTAELQLLRERIEALKKNLVAREASQSEAADALQTSEKAISEANRGLVGLSREQGELSQRLTELTKKIALGRADTKQQQALLERMIRYQYVHGNSDALRLLLNGEEVGTVARQMQYLGYVSKARAAMIASLNQRLTALTALEADALAKQAELAANAQAQKTAREGLQTERAARQQVFQRIKADITSGRREIGRLKRDEDRLTALLDQLAKTLAKEREERKERRADRIQGKGVTVDQEADGGLVGRAFETLKGKLKLPTRGELKGRFGTSREDGGATWKGLFIRAAGGQTVKAVADGRVVFADWLRGFGNLLIVDHGEGYMSLYGNNESLLKRVGERTLSGETVASVGSSGGALESGVYFELRHEGVAIDPMQWVVR
jgi:murein hydrolase activator